MTARVNYELEASIRKQRQRIAARNCKQWRLYYDALSGERFASPCLTHEMVMATKLPATNDGQQTMIMRMGGRNYVY